jgi:hypothetical protein
MESRQASQAATRDEGYWESTGGGTAGSRSQIPLLATLPLGGSPSAASATELRRRSRGSRLNDLLR